jgi:serine/threonine protein kinase
VAQFRYRLGERLGSGGFGSVFLAECLDAGTGRKDTPPREVAIKVLGKTPDPHSTGSLKRELTALRSVNHERIPTVYDWQLEGPCAFVVLRYYARGSLGDVRNSGRQLSVAQTWRLLSDLLAALTAAHRASILHLDIKPSNVLVDDNGGYALTDFGVSHSSRMSRGLLHQGQIPIALGTHGFRAPEQASMEIQSFDLRTDLWGVGATAWAMYTGIDLNRRTDVLRRAEDGNIFGLQRLSDVHLACPPSLEEVIMGLLYIDPTMRPGGAAEVLAQIEAAAAGYSVEPSAQKVCRPIDRDSAEIRGVIDSLVDPLWSSICRTPGFERYFAKFEPGEILSSPDTRAHHCFLILRGEVDVEYDGKLVDVEESEGDLLCAISTFTGANRRVILRARGEVWSCVFNEAELEQLVTCNPSVAVRMVRSMAMRIASGPPRHRD